jgi:hypothetical protein
MGSATSDKRLPCSSGSSLTMPQAATSAALANSDDLGMNAEKPSIPGPGPACLTTTLVHRYLLRTDFAKAFIDVLGTDVADLTFFVDELKQFLARQLVALSDDAGETAIL